MVPFIVTCIFLAVALVTGMVLYPILSRRMLIQERLGKITDEQTWKPTLIKEREPWQEFIARVGERLPLQKTNQSKYTTMLVAAGFSRESTPVFIGSKLLLALALPGLFAVFYALPKGVLLSTYTILYIAGLAIVGFLAPTFWLSRRVEQRKVEIFHSLPDLLDLLTVCVEAGLGLDAALVKTTENPQFTGNPLAEEVKVATREIRAGKPRPEALKDMADRTMVEDVRSFVAMLIQTERFGTSLSLALRVHADSLRVKRRQIAEEAAAKTAIKMLFPLAFFIFPALLLVMIGPAFFKISQIFK
jgi:tight adherence protein C